MEMGKELKVAIVQTTLDNRVAWKIDKHLPIKMDYAERTLEKFDDFENRFYSALETFLKNKAL